MREFNGADMIANLNLMPTECEVAEGVRIKRAFAGDKTEILQFIKDNFHMGWVNEADFALSQNPITCFIATENGKILGFACYDASAKGYFGPIGISEAARGKNVGTALMYRTLQAMREAGYVYAVIGWVKDAEQFYRKTLGAEFVPNGEPEKSAYSNMISMD